MKKLFLILSTLLFLGCGFLSSDINFLRSGNTSIEASEEVLHSFERARKYIGKSKEEIVEEFGPNIRVSRKTTAVLNKHIWGYDNLHPLLKENFIRKSGIDSYYKVDEVGFYKYDAGIPIILPDQYGVFFYFIDNVCVYVSGS